MKDAPPDALHRHIAKEAFDGQVDFTAIPYFVCDAPYWCDSHSSEAARTAKPVNPKMMLRDFWRTTPGSGVLSADGRRVCQHPAPRTQHPLLRVPLCDGEAPADAECFGSDLQSRRGLLPLVLVPVHLVHHVHHGFERQAKVLRDLPGGLVVFQIGRA